MCEIYKHKDQLPFECIDDVYKALHVNKLDIDFVVTQFEQLFSKLRQWGCSHRFITFLQLKLQTLVTEEVQLTDKTPKEGNLMRH